ncbi:hypothetical protein SLS55_004853 [Diplodia seriata]|uniref:Uncharacterized protein n=1 Tax=Diplodia seriata TaxID=420778 RepID=A0ABR3CKK5_9PEZI
MGKYDRGSFASIWGLGLGTAGPYNLIAWTLPSSVVSTVLIANSPQAILSAIYFFVNALVTNLSLAEEWSRYAYRPAALRVSWPQDSQRSTYFLQIPYRIAMPLMLFSSLLHWIISQSIFLVKVDRRDARGGYHKISTITCGYSPLGMIITLLVGVLFMLSIAALGIRKLKPGIPLAGSCSAAISAACHGPEGTSERQPLMWGAIPGEEFETEDHPVVGHCALSNGPVEMPVSGNMYA